APLHFRAESFAARFEVDLVEFFRALAAMSVTNPVESREVRTRLGIRNDVVDRDRVRDRRHAYRLDDRAAAVQHGKRGIEILAHFAFEFFDRFGDDAEAHAADAGVEI